MKVLKILIYYTNINSHVVDITNIAIDKKQSFNILNMQLFNLNMQICEKNVNSLYKT